MKYFIAPYGYATETSKSINGPTPRRVGHSSTSGKYFLFLGAQRILIVVSEPFLAPFVRCIKIDFEARVDELLDMALDIFGGKSSKLTSSGDMNRDYIIALVSAMRSNLTSLDLSLSTTDIEEICDLISQLRFGQLKHLGLRLPCNRSHTSLSKFMAFSSMK